MMVGIDVTHPGPGSREGTPSIAAVVASVDDSFVQFPASLRIQKSKQEVYWIENICFCQTIVDDVSIIVDARRTW